MTFYETALSWWQEPYICVLPRPCTDVRQKEIRIPSCFVRDGGENTLRFVHTIVQFLYEERGILMDEFDHHCNLSEEPRVWPLATYRFVACDSSIVTFTPVRGPESKSPFPKPAPTQSESTYSDSKRTSSRSGQAERSLCTSAHAVPVTRLDVYRSLLGLQSEGQLFSTSMGFLIRDDLHRSYDRYEWSWYWKDGKFYAHFFALEDAAMRGMHGRIVNPATEMRVQPREYLDPRLTAWHYQQCVLARIRGFADGFKPIEINE